MRRARRAIFLALRVPDRLADFRQGPAAGLVGIESGVVSEVINLESSAVWSAGSETMP